MAAITDLDSITFAEVKAYFGIPVSETKKEAQITATIPLCIADIRQYCGHDFDVKEREEYPSIGYNCRHIELNEYPVTRDTVTITEDGVELTEGSSYRVNYQTGVIERIDGFWPMDSEVIVEYTGGVSLAAAQDVVQCVYEKVGVTIGLRTRGYVTGDGVAATATITSLPQQFNDILERYRKIII